MAERRKNKKRKENRLGTPEIDKPSKEAYAVAKWIRENVPSKKTKFMSHNVEYFTGSRAVGALLENSPWKETLFETREQVVEYLDYMLAHKFFHRAKKIVVTEEELIKLRGMKKKGKDCCHKEDKKITEEKKDKEKEKEREKDKESTENEAKEKEDDNKDKEPKKKPKVRLEMHMEQYFSDCNDAYVWIYEPIPVYYWFFGALVVLGAIGVCLFPLWPLTIRHGVYYLSVAAAGFFVFILALALIRVVVFCLIWVITIGRHHFWLFPNLAEDVGFFASFWPLYQYDYYGPGYENEKKNKKKKRRKDKDSDCEDTCLIQGDEDKSQLPEEDKKEPEEDKQVEATNDGEISGEEGSESEKSNIGKDFEMIQHPELEDK
ncbi:translocation protein SEC62 [Cotesia glomerata]|uniref:translocation protein SEC62 n=1 Tax=Cotesia glomerata TaxID=32391 RepID=UPI001D021EB1|nr:translocation protein SEC62 [Cotesia glomerata]